MKYISLSCIIACSFQLLAKDTDNAESNNTGKNSEVSQKAYSLDAVVATTTKETETYQSGSNINSRMISSSPSGNGDITSILKTIPNVQFDNAQLKSSTPGEIDPANISISGGLFYQNNFQLDGFNMNNDLDPNGGNINGPNTLRSGRSQGLAVDTSLLESIQVQDSNISAAYGGFTGGVVEANVRKPRNDKWHGGISYQFTGDKFTQYFISPSSKGNFIISSDENYQPHFTKHLIRANVEGYITKNFGIISSFSTTRSFIPLMGYDGDTYTQGIDIKNLKNQHRYIDNYYIKGYYNPTENLTIEANIAYMPQDNTYFSNIARKSFYSMNSGGVQSGLKVLYGMGLGLLTNSLSYSWLQNSRKSEANYFMSWNCSEDKNWACDGFNAHEGGFGNINQVQSDIAYKVDMKFDSISLGKSSHNFSSGLEMGFTYALRDRLNSYYSFGNPVNLTSGQTCSKDSMFDFETCSNGSFTDFTQQKHNGQYFNEVTQMKAGKIGFGVFSYGIYAEDSINVDFDKYGSLNARFGLRLDGDNYMDKHTIAPRFSTNYIAPWGGGVDMVVS